MLNVKKTPAMIAVAVCAGLFDFGPFVSEYPCDTATACTVVMVLTCLYLWQCCLITSTVFLLLNYFLLLTDTTGGYSVSAIHCPLVTTLFSAGNVPKYYYFKLSMYGLLYMQTH